MAFGTVFQTIGPKYLTVSKPYFVDLGLAVLQKSTCVHKLRATHSKFIKLSCGNVYHMKSGASSL